MVEEEISLQIGDGNRWSFFNGAWKDDPEGALVVPEEVISLDGAGMQGHHYAFFKDAAFTDLRAHFQFRLTLHCDAGLIFRAVDPSHFYLLHFPCCGQANRAQNFWVALSKIDSSGYFKIIKLGLVSRVPSNKGIWLDADVTVIRDKVLTCIGEHGFFEASDSTYRGSGRVGVFLFHRPRARSDIRNVVIKGEKVDVGQWNEQITPRRNWFYPFPSLGGWQRMMGINSLVHTPDGNLLCYFTSSPRPDDMEGEWWVGHKPKYFSSRSKDNGRTWSAPQSLEELVGQLHCFPSGRFVKIWRGEKEDEFLMEGELLIAESKDDGYTWLPPEIGHNFPKAGISLMGRVLLDLKDGSTLTFIASSYEPLKTDLDIWTWGSHHCQAYAVRSTDEGRTWSAPVNLDGGMLIDTREGKPLEGNLDLTEVCATQMSDGRILTLIRPIYSPWMWEIWSLDGGVTWQPCLRGPFPGYATSNMLRTASGAILVAHRLPELTIHTSWDEGHTWDQGTIIDSGTWAMGKMIEVEPSLVLYIYNDSFERKLRAQFIRVTSSGLEPAMLNN